MIGKPPDYYLIAKAQLAREERQPRRRRTAAEERTVLRSPRPRHMYGSITQRRTNISEQDRRDRTFCAVLGAVLFASCVPAWLFAIAATLVATGQIA